jgi:hypothetical protein
MSSVPFSEKLKLKQFKIHFSTLDKKHRDDEWQSDSGVCKSNRETLTLEPFAGSIGNMHEEKHTIKLTNTIRKWTFLQVFDIICLVYLITMVILIFLFHSNVSDWWSLSLKHLLPAFGIVMIILLYNGFPRNRLLFTLRSLYPVAVFALAWNYLTDLVPMIYGNYWATDWVIDFDKQIFGVHPTIWIKSIYRPWLDELMNIFYCGYYLFMPSITLWLFLKKRYLDLTYALSIASLTYLSNFVLFYFFPVLGPQVVPALNDLTDIQYSGYWVSQVTRFIQSNGGNIGGACPSSHVTASIIWSLLALKFFGKTGYGMLLMTAGIIISTVYLGYHHVFDAILAIFWATLSYWLGGKLLSYSRLNSNALE